MPQGLIYFPLAALVVTLVLIFVVRRKPKQ